MRACLLILLASVTLFVSCQALAGNIYEVKYANQADVKIFRVKYQNQADLCVFVAEYKSHAKEDDGDYHLVLKSLTGSKTLIAEIPDPDQSKLKGFPGLKSDYAAARSFFQQHIDTSPGSISSLSAPLKVKITGVVFFDKIAHGNGHANNGVEIHPILSIKK